MCYPVPVKRATIPYFFSIKEIVHGLERCQAVSWLPSATVSDLQKKNHAKGAVDEKMGIKLSSCSSDLVQVCDLPLPVYPSMCVLHKSVFFFHFLLFEPNKPRSRWGYPSHSGTIWECVDLWTVGELLCECMPKSRL